LSLFLLKKEKIIMKYLAKVSASGPGFSFMAGEKVEMDPKIAKSMLDCGYLAAIAAENAMSKAALKAEKTANKRIFGNKK
jgi:hypothetical protein